ncbi:MAG: hypothetical protein JSS40_10405 [Proteobacteria bacterium]|nr:hypothetical protein [Pseudomonadota bacterium]
MNIASHLDKIDRFEKLRARLDTMGDFELWFWAAMNAGTNAVNAALHHAGATLADDVFPTQPGVYLVPCKDGKLEPAFRPPGDVLHVGRPKIEGPLPDDVNAMMQAMEVIEHHRDPCIRGERDATPEIAAECAQALEKVLALLRQRMSTPGKAWKP